MPYFYLPMGAVPFIEATPNTRQKKPAQALRLVQVYLCGIVSSFYQKRRTCASLYTTSKTERFPFCAEE